MKMKYNHIGIPTTEGFAGEIDLPRLKITVSDHANNPFGIQWQRYWVDAPYPVSGSSGHCAKRPFPGMLP